jgi:hypothetical protein
MEQDQIISVSDNFVKFEFYILNNLSTRLLLLDFTFDCNHDYQPACR